MGIGKRLSRIIKSNVNDILSAAENPQKQVDLLITEMEDGLRLAKQQLVEQLAMEKRLQRQLDEADELAGLWAGKAQQAVDAGEDNLAREALRKKKTYEELASEYDRQLFEQQSAVDDLKVQYKELEQRLREARDRRHQIASERVRRERAERDTGSVSPRRVDASHLVDRTAFDKFDEMAEKVENFEAETQAQREIADFLEPEDQLARKIDQAATKGGGERPRDEAEVRLDIELEEMRRKAGRSGEEGGSRERLSQRRSTRRSQQAPEDTQSKPRPDEPQGGNSPDDDGWGRRVEL
ncbi:MAG: PspA/IM30 family protein [Armatimonadetes bacterium]|nr:PspA/IM30 family protein [Armatimonadota bacterium]